MTIRAFQAIADLALGAKSRRIAEHEKFLNFYRGVVESVPADVVNTFGRLGVKVIEAAETKEWGIELTATDFMFWKTHLSSGKVVFKNGPEAVKAAMFNRLANQAESESLTAAERKELIALLEAAEQKEAA